MNRKRSRLVQVMVVAVVMLGLLVAAWPGMAENEKPPEVRLLRQSRLDQLRDPGRSSQLASANLMAIKTSGSGNQPGLPKSFSAIAADLWSQLTFGSYQGNDWDIYTANSDGSNSVQRTHQPDYDSTPRLNRGATKIVFVSQRDGNNEIYVMNADGSNQIRLTNTATDEYMPAWSPDSTKITFYSYSGSTNANIFVMNADGSNRRQLTSYPFFHYRTASGSKLNVLGIGYS